jgi:hypothetical protein
MASRGKSETEMLEKNLFSQLDRLIDQLKDLEEAKFVTVFLKIHFFSKLLPIFRKKTTFQGMT